MESQVVQSGTNFRTITIPPVDCLMSWVMWPSGGLTKATKSIRREPDAWWTTTIVLLSSATMKLYVYCS